MPLCFRKTLKFVLVAGPVAIVFLVSAQKAIANQSFIDRELSCRSLEKVDVWDETASKDFVYFSALVKSDLELVSAVVTGAYHSDSRDIFSDPKYGPRSWAYRSYNRFSGLDDGWNWFSPLFPKNLSGHKAGKSFNGYLQIMDEQGSHEMLKLDCRLKN
jgi:hypothetical protein